MAVSYLRQLSQLVGIQEQLLQTAVVAVDLIGHRSERAVPLVHRLDVTVAPPQRDTLQHVPGTLSPSASGTRLSSQMMGTQAGPAAWLSLDFTNRKQSNKSPCVNDFPANVH